MPNPKCQAPKRKNLQFWLESANLRIEPFVQGGIFVNIHESAEKIKAHIEHFGS
jgi:hypothetical protein